MTFSPKPTKRTDQEKTVDKLVKARGRQQRWRDRAIVNAKGKPRPKVKERNEKRIARKAANYRKVIASAFHKELRYVAYLRSHGYCECELCREIRNGEHSGTMPPNGDEIALAYTYIPCWFTKKGGKDFQRFRSKDGELHHLNYKYFGDENWEELDYVLFVRKSCHQRIESERGTRRRFLTLGR